MKIVAKEKSIVDSRSIRDSSESLAVCHAKDSTREAPVKDKFQLCYSSVPNKRTEIGINM